MLLVIVVLQAKNQDRATRALLTPRSAGTEKDNDNPTHEKRNNDKNAKFLVRGHVSQTMIGVSKR
jgi:hypothetical protein